MKENKQNFVAPKTPETTFQIARRNLLLMLAITALNLILRITQSNMYFLFSASMPQAALDLGALFEEAGWPGAYAVGIVLALVSVGLYLLCWFLSKKHRGWMVAALIFFALDTLLMFLVYEIDGSMIIDVLFHAYVLYFLISGAVAMVKMKNNPEPAVETPSAEPILEDGQPSMPMGEVPAPFPVDPSVVPAEAPVAPATVMVNGEPMAEE